MKSRSCVCFVTAVYAASGDILRALAAEAVCTAANIILVRRRMKLWRARIVKVAAYVLPQTLSEAAWKNVACSHF
jgi:hypothetical protein